MNTYKDYLKSRKKFDLLVRLTQIFIILIFMLIWQVLSDNNLINPFIFSSPIKVINTLIDLYKKSNLFKHIWVTFYETIISFSLGTILGISIATIMWSNRFIAKVLEPYLTILNSLPKVALGPIIIIWFGSGMKSIIIMALLISTIITIINVYDAFISIDEIKIKLLKSFNASKRFIFTKLVFPGSMNAILSSLIINISMSLVGVIMGEFLVSKAGIGYLIMYGSQVFNLNLVITGILLLSILSILLYYLVVIMRKKLTKS